MLITDSHIDQLLSANRSQTLQLVEQAYRLYQDGQAIELAPSYLQPPHDPRARIIAKPACIYGDNPVAGVKWISSFPGNLALGQPRASGILILNDMQTGQPIGQMQAAAINAHRTAASAVLALNHLHTRSDKAPRIGIIGTGIISWQIVQYLLHEQWLPDTWLVHDLDTDRAQTFISQLAAATPSANCQLAQSAAQALTNSDIVVLATSAGTPHLNDVRLRPDQTLLHISLRDLGQDVITQAANYIDSHALALTHRTSLHLTEEALGHRDFVAGDIHEVLTGTRDPARPAIFSPFGMAILDLAVGKWVLQQA